MEEKKPKSGKKIAGIILSAVLVIGSLGTAAALAANSSDAVPKNTVLSAPAAPSPSETIAVTQGTIQYSKDVYACPSENLSFTMERWYDPATKAYRSDNKEYSPENKLVKFQSTYYVDNGKSLVTIQRDTASGAPISGTVIYRADQKYLFEKLDVGCSFDSAKASYTNSRWTILGTEQTADGKTLKKVTNSWQKWTGEGNVNTDKEYTVQDITYLDQATGLPVKEELYEDSSGQNKLFSTDVMEYKFVADDGTLFKVPNITLTPFDDASGAPGVPADTSGK